MSTEFVLDEEKFDKEVRTLWLHGEFQILLYDSSISAADIRSFLEEQTNRLESLVKELQLLHSEKFEYIIFDFAHQRDVDILYTYMDEHRGELIRGIFNGNHPLTIFAFMNVEAYTKIQGRAELPLSGLKKHGKTLFVMEEDEYKRLRNIPPQNIWGPLYDVRKLLSEHPVNRRLSRYIS